MKLEAKSLEVLLKRGLGTEEISAEVNVESAELVNLIQKIFSEPAARTYLRRLAKNDKHRRVTQHVVVASTDIQEDLNMSQTTVVTPNEETVVSLQELKEKESSLQLLTAEQEAVVKATIQDYRKALEELTSKTDFLGKLRSQITQLKADVEAIEERSISILEKHSVELNSLHALQQELNQIRSEITNRSVINVFVCDDGTILIESDNNPLEISFEGWKEEKEALEDKFEEVISTLQLRQIKQLAKLMCLPALEDGRNYEITFDVPEVEAAYALIKEA